jgi:phosphatidylserine/phosphatidylglycerophosphate/cardiolipin synthase-like enzyme
MPKIDCHFSGSSNLVEVIYNEMLQAKNVVFVAMYTLINDTLINGLIELRQKGVKILAIFDDELIRKYNDTIIRLTNADIDWRTTGSKSSSMHNKFIIIDGVKIITGSFNWTYKASKNKENVVIIEDYRTSVFFLDEFTSIWESITLQHYKEKLGQDCYDKLQTELDLQKQDELNLLEKIEEFGLLEEDHNKQKKLIEDLKEDHKKLIEDIKKDHKKQVEDIKKTLPDDRIYTGRKYYGQIKEDGVPHGQGTLTLR